MQVIDLSALRKLRTRAEHLHATLEDDLRPFLHESDAVTFRRLPDSPSDENDVSVATTCSALMALSESHKLDGFYHHPDNSSQEPDSDDKSCSRALDMILRASWDSSNLGPDNPFTASLVTRTAGMLVSHGLISRADALSKFRKTPAASIEEIVQGLGSSPASLAVKTYPASPPVAYWFLDAAHRLGVKTIKWKALADWITTVFRRETSRTASGDEAMMDPVGMAMSACVIRRFRRIAFQSSDESHNEWAEELPSALELRNALDLLFRRQGDSGIWPKYFPFFHYPDAGSNYCFSFELLEAVMKEFGDEISTPFIFSGVEKAVHWCESNRLTYNLAGTRYTGWSSGGQIQTLAEGKPESWATAVVHMFLHELETVLSRAIERSLLSAYRCARPKKSDRRWNRFIDIDISLQNSGKTTVKSLLLEEMAQPISHEFEAGGVAFDTDELRPESLPRGYRIPHRISGLLFGPPGTSKTSLVKALAEKIGWPYLEITPSDFLTDGLEKIYVRADEIFRDLMDLSAVVVLFDEMDALVQKREGDPKLEGQRLDVTQQFLTTSMLPKLAKLHESGRLLFFFATNYRDNFDPAITRPGRFDLLVHMAPPKWQSKIKGLRAILGDAPSKQSVDAASTTLKDWTQQNESLKRRLDFFTFGETRQLLEHLCRTAGKDLSDLKEVLASSSTKERFLVCASNWKINLDPDNLGKQFKDDQLASCRQ